MPKAQFDPVLHFHDQTASVGGTLTHDQLQSRVPGTLYIHWTLAQGDQVAAGVVRFEPGDAEWRSQDPGSHQWTAGTAQAAGVIFTFKAEQTGPAPAPAVVETFTWSQRVRLEVS